MDEYEAVNMIDTLVSHTFEESCYEDPSEKSLTFNIDEFLREINALLESVPIMYTDQWKPEVELSRSASKNTRKESRDESRWRLYARKNIPHYTLSLSNLNK